MPDHSLSQEEIDALLRGETAGWDDSASVDLQPLVEALETVLESMAPVVSPLAGQQYQAGPVSAELMPWEELKNRFISPLVARLEFQGDLQGVMLTVADGSTQQQVRALQEGDAVAILNKIGLAFAAGLEQRLGLSLETEMSSFEPMEKEGDAAALWRSSETCAAFRLSLQAASGPISWQVVAPRPLVTEMLERLGAAPAPEASTPMPATEPESPKVAGPEVAAALAVEPQASPTAPPPVTVAPAHFAPLAGSDRPEHAANIGLIVDVPLQVTVELGRKRMLVRDVLELGKGSLIELEKLAGEPVDVFVNGKLIAKGEVVVIDENFGVKVTSIVTPVERLQNLQ